MTALEEAVAIAGLRAHWFNALAQVVVLSKIKGPDGSILPEFLELVDRHVKKALTDPLPIPAFAENQGDLFSDPVPVMTAKDVGLR